MYFFNILTRYAAVFVLMSVGASHTAAHTKDLPDTDLGILRHAQTNVLREQTYSQCRSAQTRAEMGACLVTSIIHHEAAGSVHGASGLLLRSLLPSGLGYPQAQYCDQNINNARSHLSGIRLGLNLGYAEQQAFANLPLSCQSIAYLQRQIFGQTLNLVDCTPTISTTDEVGRCLASIRDVYSPETRSAMANHAIALFQRRIGSAPGEVIRGFSGAAGSQVIQTAMAEDLRFCTQNAIARGTTGERREAFGSRLGNIVANALLSQLDAATARSVGVDQFGLRRIVTCDMVAELALAEGGQLADLAQDYTTEQISARANICDQANATQLPTSFTVAAMLNQNLLQTCSPQGMLVRWLDQASSASGTSANPLSLGAFNYEARNNQCEILVSGTRARVASFGITDVAIITGSNDGSGNADLTLTPRFACSYFDDRPGMEALFCGPARLFPAQYRVRASWDEDRCEWDASSISLIRN